MTGLSMLHLSDLHYGSDAYLDDDKSAVDPIFRENAFAGFHLMLDTGFEKGALDSVIVSGDITSYGNPAGIDAFRKEAAGRIQRLVRDKRAICMVPGNHDVTWGISPSAPDYFDTKFDSFTRLVTEFGCTSSLIPCGGIPKPGNGSLAFAKAKTPMYLDKKKQLLVLCLNSSMRCGELDADFVCKVRDPISDAALRMEALSQGSAASDPRDDDMRSLATLLSNAKKAIDRRSISDIAHVTQAQLDQLHRTLTQKQRAMGAAWHDLFKVVTLHHHLVPFSAQQSELKPFDITADAARVLDMLASYGFHLVLTGHKHHPYTQAFRFMDSSMHVLGGMTIGGWPPPGVRRGMRHLSIEPLSSAFRVSIADIPCDGSAAPRSLIDRARQEATVLTIEKRTHRPAKSFHLPQSIQDALDEQLFSRSFYKKGVVFTINVSRRPDGQLRFKTVLEYVVENIGSAGQWQAGYMYEGKDGRVLEATFNDVPLDMVRFSNSEGIEAPCYLEAGQSGHVKLSVEESRAEQGNCLLTSYHAASDLTVLVGSEAPDVQFNFEVLYAWKNWPVDRQNDEIKVQIKDGLLPYQGVRLHWKRKEP